VLKQERAFALVSQGWTLAAVAREVGYRNHSSVQTAIDGVLARARAKPLERYREEQRERLRQVRAAVLPRALGTEAPGVVHDDNGKGIAALTQDTAIDRLLRVEEREARLLGLDAPSRVDATVATAIPREVVLQMRDCYRQGGADAIAAVLECVRGVVAARLNGTSGAVMADIEAAVRELTGGDGAEFVATRAKAVKERLRLGDGGATASGARE
jgi:hypothetical protein